jgi:hypothetical protein
LGEAQEPQLPLSRRQAKVEPDSLELKPRDAEVAVVAPRGPEVIVVCGAVVSTGGGAVTGGLVAVVSTGGGAVTGGFVAG